MKWFRNREKGFTLVELLVVVGILGTLAAVVVPTVSRFAGGGSTTAAATELKSVQSAIDLAMSDLQLTTITATVAPISDFTVAGAVIDGSGTELYPNYLRVDRSGGASTTYAWDAAGKVTQAGSWK